MCEGVCVCMRVILSLIRLAFQVCDENSCFSKLNPLNIEPSISVVHA